MVEGVDAIPADQLMRLVASIGRGGEQVTNGLGRKVEDLQQHPADSEDLATPPDRGEVPTFKKGVPLLAQEYTEHSDNPARGGVDARYIRRPAGQALTVIGEPGARAVPRVSIGGAGSPGGASAFAGGGASSGVSAAFEAGSAHRVSLSGGASPGVASPANGAQPVPAAADTGQPAFQPGERVHYWSETHSQWMEATVKSLNYDRQGQPHNYDLNVKRGAHASRIRRWSPALEEPEGLAAMNCMGGPEGIDAADGGCRFAASGSHPSHEVADAPSGVSVCVSAAEGAVGLNGGAGLGEPDSPLVFSPGDRVEYWSDTYTQWMQALVTRIRENGFTYDLDVKKGAHRRKMRMIHKGASIPPQASAGYDGLSVQGAAVNHSGETPIHDAHTVPAAMVAVDPAPLGASAGAAVVGGFAATLGGPEANVAPHTRRPSPITGHQGQRVNGASATRGPSVAEISFSEQEQGQQADVQPYRVSIGTAPRATASIQAAGSRPKKDVQLPHVNQGGVHAGSVASGSLAASGGMPAIASATPFSASATPVAASITPIPGKVISGRTVPASGSTAVAATLGPTTLSASSGSSPARAYPHAGGAGTPPPVVGPAHQAAKASSVVASAGAAAAVISAITTGPGTMTPAGEKVVVRQVVQADGTPASRLTGASFCLPENGVSSLSNGRSSVASAVGHRVSAASTISTSNAAVAMPAQAGHAWAADLEELQMGDGSFNPMQPSLRSQLVQKLGLAASTAVEEMTGFRGGLNDGVWFLSDPSLGSARGGGGGELVLKLVRCHRIASSILTEAENYAKLRAEHPTIVSDPHVAYPCKMFSCVDSRGVKRHDLIVMRKVRGERLAELIAHKWYANQVSQLMRVFERLGSSLAEFHARYGNKQHGDFQPSNIFYDEARDDVSFIDVGGMGVPTIENDQQHFQKSMNLLSSTYGQRLAVDGMQHFELGYARSKARKSA